MQTSFYDPPSEEEDPFPPISGRVHMLIAVGALTVLVGGGLLAHDQYLTWRCDPYDGYAATRVVGHECDGHPPSDYIGPP